MNARCRWVFRGQQHGATFVSVLRKDIALFFFNKAKQRVPVEAWNQKLCCSLTCLLRWPEAYLPHTLPCPEWQFPFRAPFPESQSRGPAQASGHSTRNWLLADSLWRREGARPLPCPEVCSSGELVFVCVPCSGWEGGGSLCSALPGSSTVPPFVPAALPQRWVSLPLSSTL